ncbi:MAG: hypothetical protein JST30_04455 [Armatimonadetes bacterium]|nr:hypothetical protein [Armatimonadota bacterium]
MRHLALFTVCLAPSAFAGDVKLSITGPDGLKGTATMTNKLLEDGNKLVRLTMKLKYENGESVDVIQESSYSADGEPKRMLQTYKGTSRKTSVVVTFDPDGAQVVSDNGSGPKTNKVVRPQGSVANTAEFWFLRDRPKVGQSVEFYAFRVSEQAWAKTKAKFEGKREIVVGGKKVSANVVSMGESKAFYDEAGDLYRFEIGKMTFERTAE